MVIFYFVNNVSNDNFNNFLDELKLIDILVTIF